MAVESMEKIVALAKNRGFVYPGSEIYGGLANTWDYGPLGIELKNNMKKATCRRRLLFCGSGQLQISSLFTISLTRAWMLFMRRTQARGSAAFRDSVRPSARDSWAVRRSAMAVASASMA